MQWMTFDHPIEGSPVGFRTWVYDDESWAVNPDNLMLEWAMDDPEQLLEILHADEKQSWKETDSARAE